jgi:OFA family oxalate/formate antiporter-like MFS transporter
MSTSTARVFDRRLVVVSAILIQLCLGSLYAWSVFTPYLKEAPFSFSNTQTQAIFSVSLAVFAIVMVLAGRWQAKSGPHIVALTGGVVLGAGYILAGLLGKTFLTQLIFIGLVGGIGLGLTYVCPLAVSMKWFPDKKGLIAGLAVAGFGFGATIWVKLAGSWGNLLENMGVLNVFLLYGIIFGIVIISGSFLMVNPPTGWKPAGWNPETAQNNSNHATGTGLVNYDSRTMLRSWQFKILWFMFLFSSMAGLLVIGNMKLFGIEVLQARRGMTAAQASAIAGTAIGVFYSLANGLGRIIWGTISDKIGPKTALVLMCVLQAAAMLSFYWMAGNQVLLYIVATLIGFNFGGNFSLFPTMTSDLFGANKVGINYGWVFTAYGMGGIVGPVLAGVVRDSGLNWLVAVVVCSVACLIAAGIGSQLKPLQVKPN